MGQEKSQAVSSELLRRKVDAREYSGDLALNWIFPTLDVLPFGGSIRSVGEFNVRAYNRAYYHAKRKPRRQTYSAEQLARRREQRAAAYKANIERERANARARYLRNRERYAAASRERQRKYRAAP